MKYSMHLLFKIYFKKVECLIKTMTPNEPKPNEAIRADRPV